MNVELSTFMQDGDDAVRGVAMGGRRGIAPHRPEKSNERVALDGAVVLLVSIRGLPGEGSLTCYLNG